MNPCEALANAIIIQAVKDYRHALGTLKYYPNDRTANANRSECEVFFRSGWFELLTDLDGEVLIEKIQREVNRTEARK